MNRRTNSLACAASASAATGLDGIFFKISIIGMTRPGVKIGFGVVVRTLILISYAQGDGCAKGHTHLKARLDLDEIFFITLGDVR